MIQIYYANSIFLGLHATRGMKGEEKCDNESMERRLYMKPLRMANEMN